MNGLYNSIILLHLDRDGDCDLSPRAWPVKFHCGADLGLHILGPKYCGSCGLVNFGYGPIRGGSTQVCGAFETRMSSSPQMFAVLLTDEKSEKWRLWRQFWTFSSTRRLRSPPGLIFFIGRFSSSSIYHCSFTSSSIYDVAEAL